MDHLQRQTTPELAIDPPFDDSGPGPATSSHSTAIGIQAQGQISLTSAQPNTFHPFPVEDSQHLFDSEPEDHKRKPDPRGRPLLPVTTAALPQSSTDPSPSTVPDSPRSSPASSVDKHASQTSQEEEEHIIPRDHPSRTATGDSKTHYHHISEHTTNSLNHSANDAARTVNDNTGTGTTIVAAQLNQASKRTASGSVKHAVGRSKDSWRHGHANVGHFPEKPRIAEISAQLKTRLSYAMIKVQHGWENRSLEELEKSLEQSQQGHGRYLPNLATNHPYQSHHRNQLSNASTASTARLAASLYMDELPQYMHSPQAGSPPFATLAMHRSTSSSSSGEGGYSSIAPPPYSNHWPHRAEPRVSGHGHAHKLSSSTIASSAPSLAPAADLISPRSKRHIRTGSDILLRRVRQDRDSLMLSPQSKQRVKRAGMQSSPISPSTPDSRMQYSDMMHTTPRQKPLRMPSQQAEKDAVDTLLFMSSPNNSSNMRYGMG